MGSSCITRDHHIAGIAKTRSRSRSFSLKPGVGAGVGISIDCYLGGIAIATPNACTMNIYNYVTGFAKTLHLHTSHCSTWQSVKI